VEKEEKKGLNVVVSDLHVLAITSVAGQKYSSAATASARKRMTSQTE